MSHYTVAVITETNPSESTELETLLAPFDEGLEVEPYIYRTRAEIIDESRKVKQEWTDRINKEEDSAKLREYLISPYYKRVREHLNAETDEEFYNAEVLSDCLYLGSEDEYSTYNINSKWDWWSIGGRWSDSLLNKKTGEYCNSLQIKDWDYTYIDSSLIDTYKREWQIATEQIEPTEEEKERFFFRYKPEYYLEKYGTESNYVKCMMTFSTYAVLTPDGEWLEPGRMGWFGCSTAELSDEFMWERDYTDLISTFDPECYVTIVDCHI